MANESEKYVLEIDKATELKLDYIRTYKEKVWPETQIMYTFLSLAINNTDRAKEFCSFDTDYRNSHKFDILLHCKLRKSLDMPVLVNEPNYKPTKTESGLFNALDNAVTSHEIDWELLNKYWKATRSKRY